MKGFKILTASKAWLQKTDWICWISQGPGLQGLGVLYTKRTWWCLDHNLADPRCAKHTSSGCYVRNHNVNHQTTGPSSSLEELTKGHPIAFPRSCAVPNTKLANFVVPCPQQVDTWGCPHILLCRYPTGTDCLSTRADSVMYLYHRQWRDGTGINNSVF